MISSIPASVESFSQPEGRSRKRPCAQRWRGLHIASRNPVLLSIRIRFEAFSVASALAIANFSRAKQIQKVRASIASWPLAMTSSWPLSLFGEPIKTITRIGVRSYYNAIPRDWEGRGKVHSGFAKGLDELL